MKYALYQKTLCPDLWKEKTLDPTVKNTLVEIANDFVNDLDEDYSLKIDLLDVVIVGSIVNYNWTSYSDIDLHIITDYEKLGIPHEEAQVMFEALKSAWNIKHNIVIKGHDIELYIEDKDSKASSAAEYSVLHDKWLKAPKKESPEFDKSLIKKKYSYYKDQINSLLKDSNEDGLRDVLEKLYKFRQAGLDAGGELSDENIVFKLIRSSGLLDKLKDSITKVYDDKMSVKEAISPESPADKVISEFKPDGHVEIDLGPCARSAIEISSIFIKPEYRGFGYGKKTLTQLAELADKYHVILELEIGSGGEENHFDLVKWYESFGFKHIKGFWRREPNGKAQNESWKGALAGATLGVSSLVSPIHAATQAQDVTQMSQISSHGTLLQVAKPQAREDAYRAAKLYAIENGGFLSLTSGTPSMKPLITGKVYVVIQPIKINDVQKNDILLYTGRPNANKSDTQNMLHRAVLKDKLGWIMSGDNNRSSENWERVTDKNLHGKLVAIFPIK